MKRFPAARDLTRLLLRASMLAILPGAAPAQPQAMQPLQPLEFLTAIRLPDVRGRIDHMDIDPDGERLFVAALGNDSVEVIDLRAGKRSARLERMAEPQGVVYAAAAKRLFVANGRSGRIDVFAGSGLAGAGHVDGLDDADNLRYDARSGRLYAGYGRAIAVIDAATAKRLRGIRLAGHPESFQLESAGPRIFVNVPSAGQIAVVDRNTGAVLATWALGDKQANFAMALDEAERRLIVATRRPAALLVYDIDDGRQVASIPIAGDVDDLFFDATRKRVYAICGEGVVDIVQQRDADHYVPTARVATAPGARTGLLAASADVLYVAVPARDASVAEIRVYAVR